MYLDEISRQARNDIRALDGITTLSSRPSVTSGEIPKISRQARNDKTALGMTKGTRDDGAAMDKIKMTEGVSEAR